MFLAAWLMSGGLASCARAPEPVKISDTTVAKSVAPLVRALGGEPETLDARLAADNPSLALMLDLYEGLTTETIDGTIGPGAAARWTADDAGVRWTFELRPGLRWSNGRPLTAAHFARGIAEAQDRATAAPYADLLADISTVDASAPDRLTLVLRRPLPYLPALLSLPVAAPEPDDRAASTGAAETLPVSNGPYRLVRYVPGERVELERNPNYHGASDVPTERVTYLTLDDLNTELNLYRAGDLEVTSEVPNARIEWIREHLPGELQVSRYLSTYGYAINVTRLPDPRARAALAMALDRDAIVTKVTGAGEAAAIGWVPPGVPGYHNAASSWSSRSSDDRHALAAQSWRSAWQHPAAMRPSRLTLCTDSSENHHRTAVALADQWKRTLGIELELVELEWKVYLARREDPGDCDLVRFGWSADYADPEAFLALFETGHPQNTLGYSSRRYDAALAASRRAASAADRLALLAEAETILLSEVPVIAVFHRVSKRLVKPYVHGVAANPLGHLASRQLRVER